MFPVVLTKRNQDGMFGSQQPKMGQHSPRIWSLSGWWLSHPSATYWSVGMIIPNIWKIKNDPNHKPVMALNLLSESKIRPAMPCQKPPYLKRVSNVHVNLVVEISPLLHTLSSLNKKHHRSHIWHICIMFIMVDWLPPSFCYPLVI